jgi:hypothetical protein
VLSAVFAAVVVASILILLPYCACHSTRLREHRLVAHVLLSVVRGASNADATAADLLLLLLYLNNTALKHYYTTRSQVESSCVADVMWYFPLLQPWVDHVPVKADLSDLAEKIQWCRCVVCQHNTCLAAVV